MSWDKIDQIVIWTEIDQNNYCYKHYSIKADLGALEMSLPAIHSFIWNFRMYKPWSQFLLLSYESKLTSLQYFTIYCFLFRLN